MMGLPKDQPGLLCEEVAVVFPMSPFLQETKKKRMKKAEIFWLKQLIRRSG